MITRTPKVSACIDAFVDHFKVASSHYKNEKWEDSIERFRKAAEAFMKVFIYDYLGEVLGKEVIEGEKDAQGNPLSTPHSRMMLKDMIDLQCQLRIWNTTQYNNYFFSLNYS